MVRKIIVLILFFAMTASISTPAYAQLPREKAKQSSTGPRKQLATIVFAGLAGAILGLSTLSFYGRPQDKLSNIAVGFGVGIIIGTTYTTYKAATQPKEFYGTDHKIEPQWPPLITGPQQLQTSVPRLGYSWEF